MSKFEAYWVPASPKVFDRLKALGLEPLVTRGNKVYAYYISDGWFCGASKPWIYQGAVPVPQARLSPTGEIEVASGGDTDIHHTVIAEYVGKSPESMRQLKRKWEREGTGLWIHYVRSYKYDVGA